MPGKPHVCITPDIDHVRKFVSYAKLCLNNASYYPPVRGYRYMVALALYSKCITVAEAIISLVNAGFSEEAFGMTRTLVDIFFTLRYIANKDTDQRAERYYQFFMKDTDVWSDVVETYWPKTAPPLDPKMKKIAATYPSPHQWSGKSAKDMALEPDTIELDPVTSKPATHEFAYRVIYRWTSHYVHPTIVALESHLVQAGRDPYRAHSGHGKDMRHLAVFNVGMYVASTMVSFYRCMGDPQPTRVGNWAGSLTKHLALHHKE